ncbi:hypothetical protein H0H93_010585 [Arthromyces matolae]|nr:hypothetical protein H0H93_010585 [Arthromyces matolae]
MRFVVCFHVFPFIISTAYASIGPAAEIVISNVFIAPDGFNRSTVLAGGTYPGPAITGRKGDRFTLNVINELSDDTMAKDTSIGTSIGMGSSSEEPTMRMSWIRQERFGIILISVSTFAWRHLRYSPSSATQYCDGLRGPFVIYDPEDPHGPLYDIDDGASRRRTKAICSNKRSDSTIIALSDWYHQPSQSYLGAIPPLSEATLINGKGRYLGGPSAPLSVVNVKPGKRYRFRIIAMSCDNFFVFSIDQHLLTVIEADGENTVPHVVDSLTIFAGQRYSVILLADQVVDNYWIRAQPNRGSQGFLGGINSAILRYHTALAIDPLTISHDVTRPLREKDLCALDKLPVPGRPYPGGADINLNFVTTFNRTLFQYQINGFTWTPPSVPVLLQILSGAHVAQDLLPSRSIYTLPPNKSVELSLPGTSIDVGGPRDVVNSGFENGNATIRFMTDNSGPWFLHCHIDWHLQYGLAAVFAEDIPQTSISMENHVPASWRDLCPKYEQLQ